MKHRPDCAPVGLPCDCGADPNIHHLMTVRDDRSEHRLEAFHVICRDCGHCDVFFWNREQPGKMAAHCSKCGAWEWL